MVACFNWFTSILIQIHNYQYFSLNINFVIFIHFIFSLTDYVATPFEHVVRKILLDVA